MRNRNTIEYMDIVVKKAGAAARMPIRMLLSGLSLGYPSNLSFTS